MLIKFPQLHDIEWLKGKIEVMSLRKIAKEIGCSYGAMINVIRKYNIEVPQRVRPGITPENRRRLQAALKEKYPNGRFGKDSPRWKGVAEKGEVEVVIG